MNAVIMNYRGGLVRKNLRQMIIAPEGIKNKEEAKKLVGKTVTWTTPAGRKILGKISGVHGNSGAVRVIFAEKGLPGQALGTSVEIE